MILNKLKDKALKIATKKRWNKGSDHHYICLVISELMEAVEADRKDSHAKIEMYKDSINKDKCSESIRVFGEEFYDGILRGAFQSFIKDTVEDELADAFIRLLHLAGLRNIFLDEDEITPIYMTNTHYSFTEWVYDVTRDLMNSDIEEAVINGLGHILGYCEHNFIDLEWHVIKKMEYNELSTNCKKY